ncbi:MAG: PLP-dependent aminotransferase family protein, partial [Lachnospiraceae bacterium]|nr:PLP-dependent aminotransferase family protein [Lachnospiraceae bacterium]
DESGIDTDAVEEILKTHPEVRMIYTISSFQNPTGYTAVQEKREKLYALACKYDKVILEDDPYTELRFSGESVNPIKSLDLAGRVFYTSSLSKVICPSFRLGYLVAPKEYSRYINISKQVTDIHSNTLAQYVAWGIMTKTDYEAHITAAQEEYRKRSALIAETLKRTMHPSCKLSSPNGGLFIMMFLPDCIDAVDFTWKGIERGVVCVPGSGFVINGDAPSHSIRMCYSTAPIEDISRGAEIVGRLTWDMIEGKA